MEAKNFLLTNYPKSDYAKIINDPDFAKSVSAQQSVLEDEYTSSYNDYVSKKYDQSYSKSSEALIKYGKSKLSPKFAYLKALSSGYLYGIDSLEKNLTSLVVKYPNSEVYETAKTTLDLIKKQKQSYVATDTMTEKDLPVTIFKVDDKAAHYCMVFLNNVKDIESIKNKIADLNKEYFSNNNYEVISLPKEDKTMITIRTFTNKDDVMGYYRFLLTKPDVFKNIDSKNYSIIVITTDNVGALLKTGNFDEYNAFFNAKYLGVKQ